MENGRRVRQVYANAAPPEIPKSTKRRKEIGKEKDSNREKTMEGQPHASEQLKKRKEIDTKESDSDKDDEAKQNKKRSKPNVGNHIFSFPPLVSETVPPHTLVIGCMPDETSLEKHEYCGSVASKFWQIAGEAFNFDPTTTSYAARTKILTDNGVALWDMLKGCTRVGSLVKGIKGEVPNDVQGFIKNHPSIVRITIDSKNAARMFKKHFSDWLKSGELGLGNDAAKTLLKSACKGGDGVKIKIYVVQSPCNVNTKVPYTTKAREWKRYVFGDPSAMDKGKEKDDEEENEENEEEEESDQDNEEEKEESEEGEEEDSDSMSEVVESDEESDRGSDANEPDLDRKGIKREWLEDKKDKKIKLERESLSDAGDRYFQVGEVLAVLPDPPTMNESLFWLAKVVDRARVHDEGDALFVRWFKRSRMATRQYKASCKRRKKKANGIGYLPERTREEPPLVRQRIICRHVELTEHLGLLGDKFRCVWVLPTSERDRIVRRRNQIFE